MTTKRPPRPLAPASMLPAPTLPASMLPAPTLEVDVLIRAPAWRRALPHARRLAETAAGAAFAAAAGAKRARQGMAVEAAVVLADDRTVRTLNRDWRGQDKPTNVLAFAAGEGVVVRPVPGEPLALGDVVVALQTARAEAKAEGKRLADHFRHLVVHGMLHLLGRDHRTDAEARRMERLETTVLAGLGIADPYADRAGAPRPKPARPKQSRKKPARRGQRPGQKPSQRPRRTLR